MATLLLLRHLKSQWNLENRFAGWTDNPLAKSEFKKAKSIARKIFQFKIDKVYSSPLFRNTETVARIFDYANRKYPFFIHLDGGKMQKWGNYIDISDNDVPVYVTEKLNERYYGKLQGANKKEAIKRFGTEQVHLWRRSYDIAPPGGESLKDVYARATPFYRKNIEADLKKEKNVLVVASHNSLRALIKYIEKISDKDISDIEVPFAGLIRYDFDKSLKIKNKKTF
jgi:2,3-bisphosphoglycerate-dependent phosphoglycerate mutase